MNPYTWLILDADGTLLDFQRAEDVALGKTPIQMGLQVSGDFCDTYHAINDSLWRWGRLWRRLLFFRFVEILLSSQCCSPGL